MAETGDFSAYANEAANHTQAACPLQRGRGRRPPCRGGRL